MAGVDLDPALLTGRETHERLAARRVLAKDTHGWTVRPASPLTVTEDQLSWAPGQFEVVLQDVG